MVWPLIEFNILKTQVLCLLLNFHWCFTFPTLYPGSKKWNLWSQRSEDPYPHCSTCLGYWLLLLISFIYLQVSLLFSDILATFSTISFPSSLLHIITQLFKAPICHLPIKSEFQWWAWQWWWVNSFPSLWCYVILSISHDHHNTTTISEYYWYLFYRKGIWGSEKSSCGGCTINQYFTKIFS